MENINQEAPRRRPVRRKKTKWQIFKEAYLPTVILAVTAIYKVFGLNRHGKAHKLEE